MYFMPGIILKQKCVIAKGETDSHDDLLKELEIEDATELVKVRLVSPREKWWTDPDTWGVKVDQNITPDWFNSDYDRYINEFRKEVKAWWKEHVLVNKKIDRLTSGYYLLRQCEVFELCNDVKVWLDNSTVQEMWDSSTVSKMFGSSTVKKIHDFAVVKNMYDSSIVEEMYGSSVVNCMYKDSTVQEMWDNSSVKEMWANSTVDTMYDNSTVSKMYGRKTYNNPTVGKIYNNAIIVRDQNNDIHIASNSEISIVRHPIQQEEHESEAEPELE